MNTSIILQDVSTTQKREAKLARILVLLVFCFLSCNVCKLILNVYDIGTLTLINACNDAQLRFREPIWVVTMISANHLFLVMNSSSNLILFSMIGTQFRATLLAILHLGNKPSSSNKYVTV